MSRRKDQPTDLESTVTMPTGGEAARCQARSKSTGSQCARPARKGRNTCGVHGAGYSRREAKGERKPVGRPVTHGLYSRTAATTLAEIRGELEALELDLNNTDAELLTIKSILVYLFNQAAKYEAKATSLELALEEIERVLEGARIVKNGQPTGEGELTVAQARALGAQLVAGQRLMAELEGWTTKLLESNLKSIAAVKMRAETQAKLAEAKALENFLKLAQLMRNICWSILEDDEQLDLFEDKLRRELYGPNRLEAPKDPKLRPEDMN